jgi:flagellar biosynthesis protein FlhG
VPSQVDPVRGLVYSALVVDDHYVRPAPTLPPAGAIQRGRRVIAVGGGRGGVGKSVLTVNLGMYFAQLGKSVVICDADPSGGNLHSMLGLATAPLVAVDSERAATTAAAKPISTSVPGLSVLPSGFDLLSATPVRPSRRSHWVQRISELPFDYVLVYLGGAMSSPTLDLFMSADIGIAVTAPEPIAIETTYGFLRALFARALRRRLMKERHKLRLVERALLGLAPMASPHDIIGAIHRIDQSLAKVSALELARLAPRLVVSQTRLRTDLELGPAMSSIAERFLGISLDYLGHIEHDDAIWLSVRKRTPLLIESPTSKGARNIERVARRILALLASHDTRGPSQPPPDKEWRAPTPMNLYDALAVSRTAADDEIRRAYKRQREIFRDNSFPVVSVVNERALRDEQARIEEAYDTLLDANKRRAYDLSTFPSEARSDEQPRRRLDEAKSAELIMMQAELAREITAETQFTGDLLRRVRESQGVELMDIAQRTKISTLHLRAIEAESPAELPALVYVQGFVTEIAKFLKLDATQVTRSYMSRFREISAQLRGSV